LDFSTKDATFFGKVSAFYFVYLAYNFRRYKNTMNRLLRGSKVGILAPMAAVSFLWSIAEQKDLADSGTMVYRC